MIRVNRESKQITIPKGDTGAVAIELNVTDDEGQPVALTGKAIFAICQAAGTSYVESHKIEVDIVDNVVAIAFKNSDTEILSPGTYYWDIRIVTEPETDDNGDAKETDDVGEVHSVFAMDGMPKLIVVGVATDV